MNDTKILTKEMKIELEHFKKTGVPRCFRCHKDFKKESEYTWKPNCKCYKTDLRLSIG